MSRKQDDKCYLIVNISYFLEERKDQRINQKLTGQNFNKHKN
jgi:hypothetical protein